MVKQLAAKNQISLCNVKERKASDRLQKFMHHDLISGLSRPTIRVFERE